MGIAALKQRLRNRGHQECERRLQEEREKVRALHAEVVFLKNGLSHYKTHNHRY